MIQHCRFQQGPPALIHLVKISVVLALLYLQDQDGDEDASTPSNSHGAFPYLLALHALCCADAGLAAPEAEPQRFLRCLAPYISAAASAAQQGGITKTNSSESPARHEVACVG